MSGIGRTRPNKVFTFMFPPRFFQSLVDERPHAAVRLEIIGDELLGFARLNPKLLRKSERRKPIDDAEIHDLGLTPVIRRDHQRRNAEYLRGGQRVNIITALISLDQ